MLQNRYTDKNIVNFPKKFLAVLVMEIVQKQTFDCWIIEQNHERWDKTRKVRKTGLSMNQERRVRT